MMTRALAYTKTAKALVIAKSPGFGSPNVPTSLAESIFQVEVSLCSASTTRSYMD